MGADQMDDDHPFEPAHKEEDQAERFDRFPLGK